MIILVQTIFRVQTIFSNEGPNSDVLIVTSHILSHEQGPLGNPEELSQGGLMYLSADDFIYCVQRCFRSGQVFYSVSFLDMTHWHLAVWTPFNK